MKKIISLFQRNYDGDRLVRDEITPGAEWVVSGEGVATIKYDGTCCLMRDGKLYKRYEIKRGGHAPPLFEAANEPDPGTGKQQGWVPVGGGPQDQWHREAFDASLPNGTYELLGPKIQGNPEGLLTHRLSRHGRDVIAAPRTFSALREWFLDQNIEGLVWHHPDGRMVKIKKRDFGLTR